MFKVQLQYNILRSRPTFCVACITLTMHSALSRLLRLNVIRNLDVDGDILHNNKHCDANDFCLRSSLVSLITSMCSEDASC